MTAVMREALDRLNASSITSSSIRFSLTGGPVGWMTKTSAPRTLSWIWNQTSPSLKRARWARPTGTPRKRQMDSPRAVWALPVKTLSSLATTAFLTQTLPPRVGWGGRIRTFVYGVQSPAPYRLATPQPATSEASQDDGVGSGPDDESAPPPEPAGAEPP